jgi:cytosine/adenosine deaminase-related metal-dependent hydrolase
VRGDTVEAVGEAPACDVDLGRVALLPGLVNAHTHLELSWMRGLVPPARRMSAWARELIQRRRAAGSDDPEAIRQAVREARAAGTAVLGDITNTLASVPALAESPLSGVVFLEVIGFRRDDAARAATDALARLAALSLPPRLTTALAPHAPYSVSPQLIESLHARSAGRPYSMHVGESLEEVAFLTGGTGPWRDLLRELGAWESSWEPPSCGPVGYLERLGVLGPTLLAVHAVQLTDAELSTLARHGSTVVTCPRSNGWTGAGDPPVARFYASGVRVAIGTDSLASVPDLSVFAELAALRTLAPDVPARALLHSATRAGAEALGYADRFGAIQAGSSADLIAVDLPPGVDDVEEYLVSGVQPGQLRWLRDADPRAATQAC